MSKYEKTFYSTDGKEFRADVYSVLDAFGVACPGVQHAVKKLLMPGQRGAKSELQDLDEALVSVSRAISMARDRLTESGTQTGEVEVETKREDAMALTDITSSEILADMDGRKDTSTDGTQTGETVPEPEPMLEPEQKPKLVTWRRCVRIEPGEIDDEWCWVGWFPSGGIPTDWYPVECHEKPIETVKRLPEDQEP